MKEKSEGLVERNPWTMNKIGPIEIISSHQ